MNPTNPSPISPKIDPPQGFSFVEPPDIIYNKQIPLYRETEINPNNYLYFTYSPLQGVREYIHGHCIRLLSLHQKPWPAHVKLLFMEPANGLGDVVLAHIPARMDMYGLPTVASCVLDYELDALDAIQSCVEMEDEECLSYPESWAEVIDPKPAPSTYGRIFFLRDFPLSVRNYSYSDGVDVFHVLARISHIKFTFFQGLISNPQPDKFINFLRINPGIAQDSSLFPLHTPILVWNCRGITRPSFITNLCSLIAVHKPSIIILVESRCPTMDYCDFALRNEEGIDDFDWFNLPSHACSGGATVLWKSSHIKMHNTTTVAQGNPTLISVAEMVSMESEEEELYGHPVARRALFQ